MIKYRRDIDGLRALAVLLVVAFHAFPDRVPGGFVGVDIFFVISGFLISGIIFRKLQSEEFSFSEFYSHRARRIFPSLILVLLSCFVFGFLVLIAGEYAVLGKHIFAASGFFSNFLLKGEAGYFDTATGLKPLLHLWSLGVEEQFYIFWPLLLVCAQRVRLPFIYCIVVVGALSFGLNIGRLHRFPSEVYFLPHTRMWELLGGSLLAYLSLQTDSKRWLQYIADVKAFLGVALIAAALIVLDKKSPFPGFGALLPVLGSCLLISAGEDTWFNRVILGNRFFVAVGLISYPLYLWHWPLLSFLRIMNYADFSMNLGAVGLSFLLAWLTYQYLEKPIRRSKQALSLLCAMTLTGVLGLYVYHLDGVVSTRLASTAEASASLVNGRISQDLVSKKFCLPTITRAFSCDSDNRENPKFVVIGDSQSSALFHGLVVNSKPGERWVNVWGPSLMFLEGLKWKDEDYDRSFRFSMQALADADYPVVLMVNALDTLEADYKPIGIDKQTSVQSRLEGFSGTIARLERSGRQVILMVPPPWTRLSPVDCAIHRPFARSSTPTCSIPLEKNEEEMGQFRNLFTQLKRRHPGLLVYDPTPVLCPGGVCNVLMMGHPVYRDTYHISDFGAELIARDFLKWLHAVRADKKSPH